MPCSMKRLQSRRRPFYVQTVRRGQPPSGTRGLEACNGNDNTAISHVACALGVHDHLETLMVRAMHLKSVPT